MGWKKGQSGNVKGKPAGATDAIEMRIKHFWAMLMQENMDEASTAFKELLKEDKSAALSLMHKVSAKFVPDLERKEHTGKDGSDLFPQPLADVRKNNRPIEDNKPTEED